MKVTLAAKGRGFDELVKEAQRLIVARDKISEQIDDIKLKIREEIRDALSDSAGRPAGRKAAVKPTRAKRSRAKRVDISLLAPVILSCMVVNVSMSAQAVASRIHSKLKLPDQLRGSRELRKLVLRCLYVILARGQVGSLQRGQYCRTDKPFAYLPDSSIGVLRRQVCAHLGAPPP